MVKASSTICGAIAVAFCGSPSVSKGFSCTWQPGLAALCLSMASCTPFLMLMPRAASGPLSAPAIAMDTGGQVALPSPAGSAGVAPASDLTSAPFWSICTCSTIFRSACEEFPPLGEDWLQPAIPNTASSAELAAIALRVARPRTFHLRVSCFSAPTSQTTVRPALDTAVEHSQPVAAARDLGQRLAVSIFRIATNGAVRGNAELTDQFDGEASFGVSRVSSTTSATRFMVVRRSMAAR